MFKPRKKVLGYLLIAFLFFSSGCFIGVVYSNGSNPIWDEILGISNILWLNTTQGVNSPEYYRNNENFTAWVESISGGVTDHDALTGLEDDDHSLYLLQDGSEGLTGDWDVEAYGINASYFGASEFYLGPSNKTDILAYPEQDASYTIFKSGSTYYAKNGSTGQVEFSDTNHSAVINDCVDILEDKGGRISVGWGSFPLSAPISVTGRLRSGSTSTPDVLIVIEGQGMFNTVFEPESGVNTFFLENGTGIYLKGFSIKQPTSGAVDAIYGSDAGSYPKCVHYATFEDIEVYGGAGSPDWYSIHLKNPVRYNFGGHLKLNGQGAGGIKIDNTDSTQWGDTHWEGQIRIFVDRNDTSAITFIGSDKQVTQLNLDAFIYVQAPQSTPHENITAITFINAQNTAIEHLQVEYTDKAIVFDNSRNIYVMGSPYLQVRDGGTIFEVQSDCENIRIMNLRMIMIGTGHTITVLQDDVADKEGRTVCADWNIATGGGGAVAFMNQSGYTILERISSDFGTYSTALDPSWFDNLFFDGTCIWGQAGEAISAGEIVYQDGDEDYNLADCNSTTTMPACAVALDDLDNGEYGRFLIEGFYKNTLWTSWTRGSEKPLFVGPTPGSMTQTEPNSSGDQVQRVGYCVAFKTVYVDFDRTVEPVP